MKAMEDVQEEESESNYYCFIFAAVIIIPLTVYFLAI
jgi:hypothetical protein